ncbi:MAG: SpoIIE family protein phosphatase [Bacteroidetes bacterium]|nr:SpoIIE family protein phosphatase [Bacteroidota bacterium]
MNQRSGESTDGMDIAICSVDLFNNKLSYAGANRPLWMIRENELMVVQPNKFPVGGLQIVHEENFQSHHFDLQKNDTFYIFSDGYADQFGGEFEKIHDKNSKIHSLNIQQLSMQEQKNIFEMF